VRHKLWKRLQKLDRQIDAVDHWIWINSIWSCNVSRVEGMRLKREKLDQQRKDVRLKLKGYNG